MKKIGLLLLAAALVFGCKKEITPETTQSAVTDESIIGTWLMSEIEESHLDSNLNCCAERIKKKIYCDTVYKYPYIDLVFNTDMTYNYAGDKGTYTYDKTTRLITLSGTLGKTLTVFYNDPKNIHSNIPTAFTTDPKSPAIFSSRRDPYGYPGCVYLCQQWKFYKK